MHIGRMMTDIIKEAEEWIKGDNPDGYNDDGIISNGSDIMQTLLERVQELEWSPIIEEANENIHILKNRLAKAKKVVEAAKNIYPDYKDAMKPRLGDCRVHAIDWEERLLQALAEYEEK